MALINALKEAEGDNGRGAGSGVGQSAPSNHLGSFLTSQLLVMESLRGEPWPWAPVFFFLLLVTRWFQCEIHCCGTKFENHYCREVLSFRTFTCPGECCNSLHFLVCKVSSGVRQSQDLITTFQEKKNLSMLYVKCTLSPHKHENMKQYIQDQENAIFE